MRNAVKTLFCNRFLTYGTIFLGTLFACLLLRWGQEILMIDTRFALFVMEGLERGPAPFPWLYGAFYPDYPSLSTLLMEGAARLFGAVNYFTIVLPSAVAAAVLTTLTARIGEELKDLHFGVLGAILLFGAFEFVSICRIVSLDLYVAVAAAGSFLTVLAADRYRQPWLRLLLVLLFLFGFLARGPIGLVIPTAAVFSYDLTNRRLWRGVFTGVAAAAGLLLLLWVFYRLAGIWGGPQFAQDYWTMQVSSRMESGKPLWYYFTNACGSFAFTYPLALIVLAGYLWTFRKEFLCGQEDALSAPRMLAAWLLIVVLGMSIPGTKHLRYLTPALPAAALLAAELFTDERLTCLKFLKRLFFRLAPYLPGAITVAALVTAGLLRIPAVEKALGTRVDFPLVLTVCFGAGASWLLWRTRSVSGPRRETLLVLSVVSAVYAGRVLINEPIDAATMSSLDFVAKCEAVRPADAGLYFFMLGPDGDENKYMVHVDRKRIFLPEYRHRAAGLYALPSGALLVTRMDKFDKQVPPVMKERFELLVRGRLGRRDAALLRVK